MQNSTNMRILEVLQFLYERTDENHPATVSDIIAHLNGKGIQAVRQTVYADTNTLIDAGIDIVVVKSTQNQYFMGSRLFEYSPSAVSHGSRWEEPPPTTFRMASLIRRTPTSNKSIGCCAECGECSGSKDAPGGRKKCQMPVNMQRH